jgi:hypothetical protein
MSEGTKAELESLGAVVEKNFTRKVTRLSVTLSITFLFISNCREIFIAF